MDATGDGHGWILAAVDAYELPLGRYARRLLGDVDLAADAVQHAFVQLCGQSRATAGENPAAWLFRVCRNRALDHLRRAGREQPLVEASAGQDAAPTGQPTLLDGAADPAAAAERRELAARLRDLLRELPAPQREAIDLWCEGFSSKEIAGITGRTEGNVRVLTHRGLAALRGHPSIRGLFAADATA